MYEDEHECEAEGRAGVSLCGDAPGDAGEELEGGEEVGEGRVGEVVCVLGFWEAKAVRKLFPFGRRVDGGFEVWWLTFLGFGTDQSGGRIGGKGESITHGSILIGRPFWGR